ncbi:hypothetical protein ADH76_30305 [Enterocloster clostridioformis]|uniref:recombinase family protein n=2 Tax=Enterocloster clostridioformis TaxID=1531 RepID=UPI00080C78A4|nr:recombinase family protein [Enterocloster clostridioformis]ANU47025.1 hypothetical protein A4V08_15625 [Lachnoclostridium sp. YL32]NDO32602.1 hypothetical protein [Enterocloster clostridioformis]OXE62867.1 hypothetical protein ADH76_30305 [Enterocloster clostridioformis]QQQ98264.1 recombinase family protein [Enterocloster clostridioformis]
MEPKIFGYARVSSKGQNLDRQIFLLKAEGIDERDIFIEKEILAVRPSGNGRRSGSGQTALHMSWK